jgi:hypothetical protein
MKNGEGDSDRVIAENGSLESSSSLLSFGRGNGHASLLIAERN